MLLCFVLVGDYKIGNVDKNTFLPPLKNDGSGLHYDSVINDDMSHHIIYD